MININSEIKNIIEKYPNLWTKKIIEKGSFLHERGKPIKNIYFCENGIVRIFYYNEKTKEEITKGFLSKNDIIIPITSYVQKIPSILDFQIIKNCSMQVITIKDWEEIEKYEKIIPYILLDVATSVIYKLLNYQTENVLFDTKKRYTNLLKNYPYLSDVKSEYIASYLGVAPQSLSRSKNKNPLL